MLKPVIRAQLFVRIRVSEEKLSRLSDSVACKPTANKHVRVTTSSSDAAAAVDVQCACSSDCVQVTIKFNLPAAFNHHK